MSHNNCKKGKSLPRAELNFDLYRGDWASFKEKEGVGRDSVESEKCKITKSRKGG